MEMASAIQHGRRTSENKAAGSNSNARHQPIHPKHSLTPTLLCSSNDTNTDLGEGSSEVQTGPESSEPHQERVVSVVLTVPCKGTFGCHSFGLNSDPASAISCASDELPLDFHRLPLDFRRMTRRQPQLDVLPLDSHSSANLASAPLPLPLLFRDPVNISCLLFT